MVPTAFILEHLLKAIGVADNIIGVIDVIEKHYKLTYLNHHYKYSTLKTRSRLQRSLRGRRLKGKGKGVLRLSRFSRT